MNHDNRNKHARISKTAESILASLIEQGCSISEEQAEIALNSAIDVAMSPRPTKEKVKPAHLDKMDLVLETAEKFGFNARVRAWGKFSASMTLNICEGHDDHVSVACAGEQYWITLDADGANLPVKWSMPRSEIKNDRSDLFLIDVLETYGHSRDQNNLESAISEVLGIDALASRGYCRDVLQNKHKLKTA